MPYTIHTVLTDNGTHFTTPGNTSSAAPLIKEAMARGEIFRAHSFELACAQNDIDHRLTKPHHPWTNGQVERINRTLKDATVRHYYDTHDQLRGHRGTSSPLTTSPAGSRPCAASPPTSTSARYLQANRNASGSTRPIKCRD